MAAWQITLALILGALALAIGIEAWLKRNRPRRPLAEKFIEEQPADDGDADAMPPPLGMEAVNFDVLRESERRNLHASQLGARDIPFWSRQMQRALRRSGRKPGDPEPGKEPGKRAGKQDTRFRHQRQGPEHSPSKDTG